MTIAAHPQADNDMLRVLPYEERQRMHVHSEQVNLAQGEVLCETGEPVYHVYFPNNGIISLLTSVDGYASVEVGLVGREGMAGMGLFLGSRVSAVRMLVQGSSSATRIKASSFLEVIPSNPVLQRELSHYLYVFMAQMAQIAACNRHHPLEQRLARRLLMTHDRVQTDEFHLTQEFLAQMLGVRRAGVTVAARMLQEKRLISYRRGEIIILDRKGLECASCRCHRDVNTIRDRMLDEVMDHPPRA